MKTDEDIKREIKDELLWNPKISGSDIGVTVKNGHVTLSGTVNAYPKKINTAKVAEAIRGVTGVDNAIEIRIIDRKNDSEIEKTVMNLIKWNSTIDQNKIRAEVKNGWITLEGSVPWNYQKTKAGNLVADISGVTGVTNHIEVKPFSRFDGTTAKKIETALKRNHQLNKSKIKVEAEDSKVTLTGFVHSISEKKLAESAAWSAPGIAEVVNNIMVDAEHAVST